MFWNEAKRQWERHPDCRCNHGITEPCLCSWLRPLDDQGKSICGTAVEELGERIKAEARKARVGTADEGGSMTETSHTERLLKLWLRAAWDDGIKTAKGYGDNVHHLEGEQADRRFTAFVQTLTGNPSTRRVAARPTQGAA
jgi:hypothetical protein